MLSFYIFVAFAFLLITIKHTLSIVVKEANIKEQNSFEGVFIRKLGEREVYFGNSFEEIIWNLDEKKVIKTFTPSLCFEGSHCPFIMKNKLGNIYSVSRNNTHFLIKDLNNNFENAQLFEKKIFTMIQYNYTICLVISEDKDNPQKRMIEQFNLEKKTFMPFNLDINIPIGMFVTKNKIIIIFIYDNDDHIIYYSLRNINSEIESKVSLEFSLDNSFGDFQSIEFSNNNIVSCFSYQDERGESMSIHCFSGYYNNKSYRKTIGPWTIISKCSNTNSFSLYKQGNDDFGLVACIGNPFKLYIFGTSLVPSMVMTLSHYHYVDFTMLSTHKLFFNLVEKNEKTNTFKLFQTVYLLPYCPNIDVYPTLSTPFYFSDLFEQSEEGMEDEKQLFFTILPSLGKISSKDNREIVSFSQSYKIDYLTYLSNELIQETIGFYIKDNQIQDNSIETGQCLIVVTICNVRCKTCLKSNNGNEQKCQICNNEKGYYLIADKNNECISIDEKPQNYYFNVNLGGFFPCYKNCASCEKSGDENENNCLTCIDNYYLLENTSNCIQSGKQPSNYYFDKKENRYKKCYFLCNKCENGGDKDNNECLECIDGYSFDNKKNCIFQGTQKSNYYLDKEENIYKKCYLTCATCNYGGNEKNHNCTKCEYNLEWTTGNNLGNCLNLSLIPEDISEIDNFLPILTPLDSIFDIKILQISGGSKFYYYSTRTIFSSDSSNFSYISLDQCERTLIKEYEIKNIKILYIAELLHNNDPNKNEYHVYDSNGELLDLSKCKNNTITKYYPMIKNYEKSSLITKILSKNLQKEVEKINLYNSSSPFYTDPCNDFYIDNQFVSQLKRQEMYMKDLTKCPSHCTFSEYSKVRHVIYCKCNIDQEIFKSKIMPEENYHTFDLSEIKDYSFYLFQCVNLITKFPGKKGILQWIGCSFFLGEISFLFLFNFLLKKIAENLVKTFIGGVPSNPPTEMESKNESGQTQEIEMIEIDKDTKNKSHQEKMQRSRTFPFSNNSLKFEHFTESYQNLSYNKEEYNQLFFSKAKIKDKRNFILYISDILNQKLFIISCYTYENIFYPICAKIGLHLFTLSLVLFFNALFYPKEEKNVNSFQISQSIYSFLLTIFFQKIIKYFNGTYVFYDFKSLQNKEIIQRLKVIIRNIKKRVYISFSFYIFVSLIIWYYLFIFGIVKGYNQNSLILLSFITILIILTFQFILAFIISILRLISLSKNYSTVHLISRYLYYAL